MGDTFQILLTASRDWDDLPQMGAVLMDTWHDAVMLGACLYGVTWRHGGARGGDAMAHQLLVSWGFRPDRCPADWPRCAGPKCKPSHRVRHPQRGEYCPTAGTLRDEQMVARGAHACLAFIAPCVKPRCRTKGPHGSHGASYTADLTEKADIPTHRFHPRAGSK